MECWDPRSRSRVGVLDVGLSGLDYQRYWNLTCLVYTAHLFKSILSLKNRFFILLELSKLVVFSL